MPRALRPRAKVFIKATPPHLQTRQKFPKDGDGPRLWNAKRRIQTSKGLPMIRAISLINDRSKEGYLKWPEWRSKLDRPGVDGKWWKLDRENLVKFMEQNSGLNNLSEDVKEFFLAGSNNLSWSEVLQILLNPPKYFSKPHNVPFSMRKQVYLYVSEFPNSKGIPETNSCPTVLPLMILSSSCAHLIWVLDMPPLTFP